MPTPSPIIAATVEVKSAVGRTAETSGIALSDRPMPISALTIGNPIATTDPKAISRITTAAARPMPSVAGTSPLTKGSPPRAICSVGGLVRGCDLLDCRRRVLDRWWAGPHERHRGERDASRADLFGMVERAVDVVDARQRTDLVDDGRRRGEVVGLEHDSGAEAGHRRHVGGGKVVGALRIGAVETVVDVGAGGDHAAEDDDADECGDPDDDGAVAVVDGGGSKFLDHGVHCEASVADVGIRWPGVCVRGLSPPTMGR